MKFDEISKRLRTAIVLCAIWVCVIFLIALGQYINSQQYLNSWDFQEFIMFFFGLGVFPVVVYLGIIWIGGASNEKPK